MLTEIEAPAAQAPSPAHGGRDPTRKRSGDTRPRPRAGSRVPHLRARRVILSIGGNLGVPVTSCTVRPCPPWKASDRGTSPPIMRASRSRPRTFSPTTGTPSIVGSAISRRTFAQTKRIERRLVRTPRTMGRTHHRHRHIQVRRPRCSEPPSPCHIRAPGTCLRSVLLAAVRHMPILEGVGRVCDLLAGAPDRERHHRRRRRLARTPPPSCPTPTGSSLSASNRPVPCANSST